MADKPEHDAATCLCCQMQDLIVKKHGEMLSAEGAEDTLLALAAIAGRLVSSGGIGAAAVFVSAFNHAVNNDGRTAGEALH